MVAHSLPSSSPSVSPATTAPRAITEPQPPPRWSARFGSPPRRPLLQGLLGGVLMVVGGFGSAGVLVDDPFLAEGPLGFWRFGHGHDLASALVYAGVALLAWAWIQLGRGVLARRVGGRAVLCTATVWLLPMLITPPLFTRDVYSYLAQGALPLAGFDPYKFGPQALVGPLADNVHFFWASTPAPYGPAFILLAKGIAAIVGENLILGVILMRLGMLVGLVLLVGALPGLVRHLGGRVPIALWLTAASPIMVIHLVGGIHNDLLLLGLLAAGSLLVLERRPVAGIAVVTLAMAVKATAGLALPFLVLIWAARLPGSLWVRIAKAAAAGIAVSVAVFASLSVLAGVGLGWLPALSASSMIVNWMSWSTGSGLILHWLVDLVVDVSNTGFIAASRALGAVALLLFGVRQWLAARHGQADALRRAGLVLFAAAVLSPATLPWYFAWCMAMLAMIPWSPRSLAVAAFFSIWFVMIAYPNGELALFEWGYLALAGLASLLAAISLLRPDPLGLRSRSMPAGSVAMAPSAA